MAKVAINKLATTPRAAITNVRLLGMTSLLYELMSDLGLSLEQLFTL